MTDELKLVLIKGEFSLKDVAAAAIEWSNINSFTCSKLVKGKTCER